MDMLDIYKGLMETINEIDVQLDSLSGGKGATRRKVINQLVETSKPEWESAVNDINGYLDTLSADKQAALFFGIVSALRGKFEKSANTYVEGVVDSAPKQEALISEEEAANLSAKRSEIYKNIKSVVELAAAVGGEELEMPPIRRGSSGPRGPRNLSLFVWSINEEVVDMTIGQIAKDNGYEKAAELTKALKEAGFDTREGSELKAFTLPNGKVLSGYRDDDDSDDDESDED